MYIFSSGFIANFLFRRTNCKKLGKFPLGAFWGNFGGILRDFWGIFWYLGYFQSFIYIFFFKYKKE
jgi:hypothetical protein